MNFSDADYPFNETTAKAFCKWYLRTSVFDVEDEFESDEERHQFFEKRERRLTVQLDDLTNLNFSSSITCPIKEISYYKIVKSSHSKPLSSVGSTLASSRFNFKNIGELATRAIYFGQDKSCCYAEKFHLDVQKFNYSKLIDRKDEDLEAEFKFEPHEIHEYRIAIENVLVLTSEASYKALGIPDRVVKDEWYSVNDDFEIPTAGQILGRAVKNKGYSGILYTSVRSQFKNNLVLFEENTGHLEFELVSKRPLVPEAFESDL